MQPLGLNEIRERYLSFFESKGHLRLPSFSLVPQNDPSILLINAGMTPLKPYFTGAQTPPCLRVTTCQKCIRTPDIENVGHTSRHGTYFEMLGNFSFGDYFKPEIIPWAWEFLTKNLEMPEDKLFPSVFEEDDEAFAIWCDVVGVPEERITKLGKADNFWEHGTGPCGPCSEIYFDRGVEKGCGSPDCCPGCECDRFVEIWNLVFTQYNREADGSYTPLAKKNIDTGGGLERFACVMQGVDNLFEVDTVRKILDTVCEKARVTYGENSKNDVAIRVITDHMRSSTMMISDGVLPSNEGRGYVLRRLMRRAARFGRLLGIQGTFLTDIAEVVISQSSEAYPELASKKSYIMTVISKEEEAFFRTLEAGTEILNDLISKAKADSGNITCISGSDAFRLHDTYGFPLDLTKEIASDAGLSVDEDGFASCMKEQKDKARAATKAKTSTAWGGHELPSELLKDTSSTEFVGYDSLSCVANLIYLLKEDDEGALQLTTQAFAGDTVIAIFDKTSLYATMGGQQHDIGRVSAGNFVADVISVDKDAAGKYLHTLKITSGSIEANSKDISIVSDATSRLSTCRNHTATHILQKALRMVIGDHVEQAGSFVSTDRLRFDFTHFASMTDEELDQVERIVNEHILANEEVITRVMKLEEARKLGAMALFGEKYGETVRVVTVGDLDNPFSMEFCGGTHLTNSNQVGQFRIISETGIASGVRRIEALTGIACYEANKEDRKLLSDVSSVLKTTKDLLVKKVEGLQSDIKSLEKEISSLNKAKASDEASKVIDSAIQVAGFNVVVADVESEDAASLRDMADGIKDKIGSGVVFLASKGNDKLIFTVMATADAIKAGVHSGNIVKQAASVAGGGGGGRPDMAQAGGKDISKLQDALDSAIATIKAQLKA